MPEYQLFSTGMRAMCSEAIKSVQVAGQEGKEKVFVEIQRKMGGVYGRLKGGSKQEDLESLNPFDKSSPDPEGRLAVVENRRLVFMREKTEEEKKAAMPQKGFKCLYYSCPEGCGEDINHF